MLWSAAGQTEDSVAFGTLLHYGKLSPLAATAHAELFSVRFKGQKDTEGLTD